MFSSVILPKCRITIVVVTSARVKEKEEKDKQDKKNER